MNDMNNFPKMNMISVNVHGIRTYVKRQKMFTWLSRKTADIIFLQETYSSVDIEKVWQREWKGDIVFSHGTNHSKGVAMLFKGNVDYEVKHCKTDKNGRYIIMDVDI